MDRLAAASFAQGFPNVLVLEDDPVTRLTIVKMIRELAPSASIRWSESADQFVHALKEGLDASEVDLVLCDVNLDGTYDGLDAWLAWSKRHRGIPFILVSGLAPEDLLRRAAGRETSGVQLIQKPLRRESCDRILQEALASMFT